MKRRDFDYVVITLLVGSSLYVFFTGLIADTMGLHHFGFHSQVGYFWMFLAVMHLIQTWVRVKAFARHRFRGASTSQPKPRVSLVVTPQKTVTTVPNSPSSYAGKSDDGTKQAPATVAPRRGNPSKRRYLLLVMLAIATGIGFDRLFTPSETFELSEDEQDLGLLYHRWSQPGYGEAIGTLLNWGQQPPRYKTYADAPQINLPLPDGSTTDVNRTEASALGATVDLVTVMAQRRSRRTYNTRRVLPLEQLSQLLYLAHGITQKDGELRTIPSSGALYPLEIYPIVHRVEGLEPGLYHHAIQNHALELVKSGDLRQPLVSAGLNQDFLGEANVCFVVSGIFQRTRWKYHERTYRYVLMEAGHLGQNLYLAATALGLGSCCIGAFLDNPLNQLLELDGKEEAALYLITVGEM
ncbi:MAG: SagB/ThcOx family dehydrogenase [Leptolyngbyaceae cyanobacterium]